MQRIAAALAVLLAAPSCTRPEHPQPIVGNSHAADTVDPARDTLATKLAREIGAGHSVAILPTAAGLVAESSTGERRTVVVPGSIAWALVDEHAGVVWFAHDDRATIYALDLAAPPATKPHAVIEHAPERYGELAVRYLPAHIDPDEPIPAQTTDVALTIDLRIGRVVLLIGPTPSLSGVDGVYDNSTEIADGVTRDTKVTDLAFATALYARVDHSGFVEQAPVTVDGIDRTGCETPTDCGTGVMVTGTKYANIVVQSACVDGCSFQRRIYDLTTKSLVGDDWGGWLWNGAELAPDHTAFVADGVVVRFDRGPLGAVPDDRKRGGGWLGGNPGDRYY